MRPHSAALLLFLAFTGTISSARAECDAVETSPVHAISSLLAANSNKRGDWLEATTLPYRDGWLDEVTALSGLVQQDGLKDTIHDNWRCGAMVGLAGAVVGGRGAFERLLSGLEKKRAGAREDRKTLAAIRSNFEADLLTAADLHRLGDIVYRAHVGHRGGSSDGQISAMLRASGMKRVDAHSAKPAVIAATLAPGEAFPMNFDLSPKNKPNSEWHVVLVWKDAAGELRIYDSDRLKGSQVLEGDLTYYTAHKTAEAPLGAKFSLPGVR